MRKSPIGLCDHRTRARIVGQTVVVSRLCLGTVGKVRSDAFQLSTHANDSLKKRSPWRRLGSEERMSPPPLQPFARFFQVIRALHAKRDVTKPITGHFNDPECGNFNASDAGHGRR